MTGNSRKIATAELPSRDFLIHSIGIQVFRIRKDRRGDPKIADHFGRAIIGSARAIYPATLHEFQPLAGEPESLPDQFTDHSPALESGESLLEPVVVSGQLLVIDAK